MRIGIVLSTLIASLLFIGCERPLLSPGNHFKYDGVRYELEHCVAASDTMTLHGELIYYTSIFISSQGLHVDFTNLTDTGYGDLIGFTLINDPGILPGTYQYKSILPTPTPPYLMGGSAFIGYDAATGQAEIKTDIEGGTVSVKKRGTKHIIDFSFEDENGLAITGYFKGELEIQDPNGK